MFHTIQINKYTESNKKKQKKNTSEKVDYTINKQPLHERKKKVISSILPCSCKFWCCYAFLRFVCQLFLEIVNAYTRAFDLK